MKYQYIDIHTHHLDRDTLSLINVFPDKTEIIEEDKFYSLGLHPWEIKYDEVENELKIVEEFSDKKNILAIGEMGLDKYKANFDLQKDVFIKQIRIAKNLQKPIVIHCVKAFSELLEIFKLEKINVPVIIHRYSGNKTIAEQLLGYNCYFSFGHELFHSKSKVSKVFKSIDLKNIFLETDDSDKTIQEIYNRACEIKDIEQEVLISSIQNNFSTVFGNL